MSAAKAGAARLLGCYRSGDAHDPETYIAAVVAVLAAYPAEVIRAVTEPASGIASTVKWLPAIAEIKEACEARMPSRSARWAESWDRAAAAQLAQRQTLALTDRRRRPQLASASSPAIGGRT